MSKEIAAVIHGSARLFAPAEVIIVTLALKPFSVKG
jgi:hypothetical protein